ncbi:MAG: CapA family protein [Thermomicrobiaceae bacterium]
MKSDSSKVLNMKALFQTLLSRRSFVASGAALATLFLASCEDATESEPESTPVPSSTPESPEATQVPPTPTPEPTATAEPEPTATPSPTPEPPPPLSFWVDPALAEVPTGLIGGVEQTLQNLASERNLNVSRVDQPGEAVVRIYPPETTDEQATRIHGEPLIPVVRVDNLVDQISIDDLAALFTGGIENWQMLGGQDWIVHPVVGESAIRPRFLRESPGHSEAELTSVANEHPGMLALIPRSAAHFHVQVLVVEDIDPLREELTRQNWHWWEWVDAVIDDLDEQISADIANVLSELGNQSIAPRRSMITVTGDVMLGRTPHRIMAQQGDWTAPFHLVVDELQKGDLTIGNLECVITDSFTQPEDPTTFSLMTYTNAVQGLEYARFHALSSANNHSMDFGLTGMRDTIAALESAGIQHFGTGENLAEARQPCLLEHDGITFGFLGYDAISMQYAGATPESGGVAPLVQDYFVEDIQRLREQADVVIPYFHWGVEYTLTPTENDRRMAHAAVDAGADLVLGSHPHWVQGMEIYQDTAIFYSLSNFVFDQEWSFETKQGLVVHLIFDGARFVGYRVVPVLIEDFYRPRIVEDEIKSTILGRFWESTSIIANTPVT